ncbi:MAG: hypothetical protein DRO18_00060 [Thermoprotei archaeon]|nr:MAG: hypothetical protein DRO18_00060 [Thermoprotei archaeon]
MLLITFLLTLPLNIFLKRLFRKERPRSYYSHYRGGSIYEGSFPSFHAQFAFCEALTHITVVYLVCPEGIKFLATSLAIAILIPIASLVAWSRVCINVHYLIDIIGGGVIGGLTGILFTYLLIPYFIKTSTTVRLVGTALFFVLLYVMSEKERRG